MSWAGPFHEVLEKAFDLALAGGGNSISDARSTSIDGGTTLKIATFNMLSGISGRQVDERLGMAWTWTATHERGDASHDGATGQFDDAWTNINPGQAGLTFPSDAPDRRMDYIYFLPGAGYSVQECETFGEVSVDGLYASDHLGVICTFVRTGS